MSCVTGVFANFVNDCANSPLENLEEVAYFISGADVASFTKTGNNYTALTLKSGKQAYTVNGFKKGHGKKTEAVVSETLPTQYTYTYDFQVWSNDSTTLTNLEKLDDLIVIIENVNKGNAGNGAFNIIGLKNNMTKATLTHDSNADSGVYKVALTSKGNSELMPVLHITDYATTKAYVEALLTPAP